MATMLDRVRKMLSGEIDPPPVAKLIGFQLVSVDHGKATVTLQAGEQHWNPMGTLHGGILCDITDAAMGIAYASTLGDGESFTTLEFKINFLKPIWKETLRAEATVVRAGRTIGLVECSVTDSMGNLIARASSTCMALRGEQARSR